MPTDDLLELIRRRQGQGANPGLFNNPAPGGLPLPGFGDPNPVAPGGGGFPPAQVLQNRPDNLFFPGVGPAATLPGYDKPALGDGGLGKPFSGDSPLPAAGGPPAAPAFNQRLIDVSPLGSGAVMRQVNNRDDELMALAERAGARASANAMGTGYLPDGSWLDPRLGMHAAQAASSDFLKSAALSDENASRERMGLAGIAGQKDIAGQNNQARLQEQELQNQGSIAAAKVRADHEAAMGMNKATLDAIAAMNAGTLDPKAFGTMMDLIKSHRGSGAGLPGVPAAAGAPAAGGAAPAPVNPVAAAEDLFRRNQVVQQFAGDFDPKEGANPASITKMIDRLQAQNVSPEERAGLVEAIRGGKFGDPAKFIDSLHQVAAKNYLLSNGIQGGNDPTNKTVVNMGVPFGDDPNPLFSLRRQPDSTGLGRTTQWLGNGLTAQPYNQVVTRDGRTIPLEAPFNPAGLNNALGFNGADKRAAGARTSHSAQLLQELIRATQGK